MARMVKLLTALEVAKLKEPGMHPVGPTGLYLQVTGTASRAWVYRYMLAGKPRWAGLGSAASDGVSLAAARTKREEMQTKIRAGIDPVEERKQERRAAREEQKPRSKPFRQVAADYIANHENGWKNAVHRKQWSSTLRDYVYPLIGDVPVDEVTTEHVYDILTPIWHTKAETARRVRARIERVLDAAKVLGLRSGENPARWDGHLAAVFPHRKKKSIRHHAAMPVAAVPAFMEALRERDAIATRALEFCMLTAARTSEVLGATWGEFDLRAKTWTVPAARMKAGIEHRVPLCGRAIAIVNEMAAIQHSDLIFPGTRGELSNMSMAAVLKRMGQGAFTVHGMRSTFRDWAAETTAHPNHVVEMALAHTISSEVEAAYRRGDLFAKRVRLMDDWGKYCTLPPVAETEKVVPMRR
jgi:integrase